MRAAPVALSLVAACLVSSVFARAGPLDNVGPLSSDGPMEGAMRTASDLLCSARDCDSPACIPLPTDPRCGGIFRFDDLNERMGSVQEFLRYCRYACLPP